LSLHQVGRWPQKSKIKIFQHTHTHAADKRHKAMRGKILGGGMGKAEKSLHFRAATKLKYATKRGTSKMQELT